MDPIAVAIVLLSAAFLLHLWEYHSGRPRGRS